MNDHTPSVDESVTATPQVVSGRSARNTAAIMDIGNIVAIVVVPLVILWCGASMLVFAMNRHHPNPKVGYYTQWAAYRFYGVVGFFTAVAVFIPLGGWIFYLIAWLLAVAILVPWSIRDLLRIYRDDWQDVAVAPDHDSRHHD